MLLMLVDSLSAFEFELPVDTQLYDPPPAAHLVAQEFLPAPFHLATVSSESPSARTTTRHMSLETPPNPEGLVSPDREDEAFRTRFEREEALKYEQQAHSVSDQDLVVNVHRRKTRKTPNKKRSRVKSTTGDGLPIGDDATTRQRQAPEETKKISDKEFASLVEDLLKDAPYNFERSSGSHTPESITTPVTAHATSSSASSAATTPLSSSSKQTFAEMPYRAAAQQRQAQQPPQPQPPLPQVNPTPSALADDEVPSLTHVTKQEVDVYRSVMNRTGKRVHSASLFDSTSSLPTATRNTIAAEPSSADVEPVNVASSSSPPPPPASTRATVVGTVVPPPPPALATQPLAGGASPPALPPLPASASLQLVGASPPKLPSAPTPALEPVAPHTKLKEIPVPAALPVPPIPAQPTEPPSNGDPAAVPAFLSIANSLAPLRSNNRSILSSMAKPGAVSLEHPDDDDDDHHHHEPQQLVEEAHSPPSATETASNTEHHSPSPQHEQQQQQQQHDKSPVAPPPALADEHAHQEAHQPTQLEEEASASVVSDSPSSTPATPPAAAVPPEQDPVHYPSAIMAAAAEARPATVAVASSLRSSHSGITTMARRSVVQEESVDSRATVPNPAPSLFDSVPELPKLRPLDADLQEFTVIDSSAAAADEAESPDQLCVRIHQKPVLRGSALCYGCKTESISAGMFSGPRYCDYSGQVRTPPASDSHAGLSCCSRGVGWVGLLVACPVLLPYMPPRRRYGDTGTHSRRLGL